MVYFCAICTVLLRPEWQLDDVVLYAMNCGTGRMGTMPILTYLLTYVRS
jgi:hypothetical protein